MSGLKRSEEKQAKGLTLVAQQTIEQLHQQAIISRANTAPPAEFQVERVSAAPPSTVMHGPEQHAHGEAHVVFAGSTEEQAAKVGSEDAEHAGKRMMVQQSSSFYSELDGESGGAQVLTVGHEGSGEAAHQQLSADLTQVAAQLTQEVSSVSQLPNEASFTSLTEQPSSLAEASLDTASLNEASENPLPDSAAHHHHRPPPLVAKTGPSDRSPPMERRPHSPTSAYPPNSPTSHHVRLETLPPPPFNRIGSYGRVTPSSNSAAASVPKTPVRDYGALFLGSRPSGGTVFRSSSPTGRWSSDIQPHNRRSHTSMGHRRTIADIVPNHRGLRSSGLSSRSSDGRHSPSALVQPRPDLPGRSHMNKASPGLCRSTSPFGHDGGGRLSPRWSHFVPIDSRISAAAIHGHPSSKRSAQSHKGARLKPL